MRSIRLLAALAVLWAAFPVLAATHTVSVYVDDDNNAATGCVVALPGTSFPGAELEVRTTIVTDSSSALVDQVEVLTCNGTSFVSPVVIDSGDWPITFGSGEGSTSAIETYLPASWLVGARVVRLAIGTTADAMTETPGDGPILFSFHADVPLSPAFLFVLALSLVAVGTWMLRQHSFHPFVIALLASLIIVAAVPAVTWTGPALATDPAGDAPANADLVSFYAQEHNGDLVMRIDADITPDGGSNLAPVVSAGADQTITLPDNGAALSGTATDDGLPGVLTLQWTQVSGPTGSFVASPMTTATDAGFAMAGTYVLRLTANDGALSSSDDVTVTVIAETAGPPILQDLADRTLAVGETLALEVAAGDPNPRDTLTFSLTTAPVGAQLTPAGSPLFRFTPTLAQVGPQSVTVRVQDQTGANDTETFVITVVNGNEPPVLAAQASERIAIGVAFSRTLTATDPDPGDTLSFALLSGPAGMSLTGSQLQWTPAIADRGDHPVTVAVTDAAGARDQERFVLTVTEVAAPVAHDDSYEIVLGQTLTVAAPGVLANDVDPEGGAMTAAKTSDPDKGTVSAFGADGSFTYVAPPSVAPPPPLNVRTKHLGFNIGGVFYAASQVVGDLDGDGMSEIVFQYPNNSFAAVKHDGTTLFTYSGALPAPNADCWAAFNSHLALGDIDDDGDVEIVLGVTCTRDQAGGPFAYANNRVAALSYNPATSGIVLDWLSPSVSTGANRSDTQNVHFTIARLATNETPSVLWARTYNSGTGPCSAIIAGKTDNNCRVVTAHSGDDGSITRRFYYAADANPIPDWGANYGFLGATVPIVADLDGEGEVEIVADGTVWNLDGTVALAFDGSATTQPPTVLDSVIADLDGDGSPEIITAQLNNGFGSLGPLSAYHADGTLMWRLQIPGSTVQSRMTAADLDGDGRPEILFSIYNTLYAVDADGRYKWVRTFDYGGLQYLNPGGGFSSRFAVYDLNGDGIIEVLVQDGRNDVRFLRGDTGETQTSWHYSDPDHPSEPTGGSQGQMAPTVADLDGDGNAEIVIQHDINLNNTFGIVILEGVNPWRAARGWFNQRVYTGNNIASDGQIPSSPPRYWTDPATNLFGQQPPEPYAEDPRERTETSFQYEARNAALDSPPATVTIGILPENRPPVVTSTPPAAAPYLDYRFTPPGPFTYQIAAVDPDGDTISYQLTYRGCGGPAGVTVSSAGLFSFADGFLANPAHCLFAVELSGGLGGVTQHVFVITFTTQTRTVPNLIGRDRLEVPILLSAVDLAVGRVIEIADAAPAGTVILQSPASDESVLRGAVVDITVSTGPQPRVVPNVAGRTVTLANGLLTAAGFTTGATTYVYDPDIPRNEVLSQSPAGGTEVLPGPVALTVSAGTGLELRLERTVTTADVPIGFTAVSFTLAGVESPAPPLNFVVTAIATPFAGSLPTVSGGNTVTFTSATRGAFRITATDPGTGRMATADFAVGPPRIAGQSSQTELFAELTETLTGFNDLVRQAKAAADASDTATATTLLRDAVLLWRGFDRLTLPIAAPFSPESGFPPEISDLPPAVVPGPDDLINRQLIAEAAEALRAWTDGLREDTTTIAELETLADAFIVKAHLLRGLTPGEYGTVLAAPEYAVITTRRIPDLMDALTDELAPVVGLSTSAPTSSQFAVAADSTLAEIIVAQAINYIADRINEAQVYTKQILTQALYGAAIVGVTQHVKSFVQGKELEAVISGASISFCFFESPYTMIEGKGLERENPDLNTVYVIGPQLFSVVRSLVDKIKGASKLNVDPDEPGGESRYKNLDEIYNGFAELIGAATAVGDAFDNADQTTELADRPCIFTSDPRCVQLLYPDGFISVYEYAPPQGLSQLTGLPLPIVFMVKNNVNGQILFGTPIFFPSVPEP